MSSTDTVAEADALGRRERKKQATRRALHEAAWDLVEERGLANVTIEAITDRVDVAARTFFNYYSSKEEAVLGSDTDRVDQLVAMVGEHLDQGATPLDALHAALRADAHTRYLTSEQLRRRMHLVREHPTLFAAAARQWEEMARRLAACVAEATGTDTDRDVYPSLVVGVTVLAARIATTQWADHPDQPLESLVDDAIAAVRAGLPPPGPAAPEPIRSPRRSTP